MLYFKFSISDSKIFRIYSFKKKIFGFGIKNFENALSIKYDLFYTLLYYTMKE